MWKEPTLGLMKEEGVSKRITHTYPQQSINMADKALHMPAGPSAAFVDVES